MEKRKMVFAGRLLLGFIIVFGALMCVSCMQGVPVLLEDEPRYAQEVSVNLSVHSRPRRARVYLNGRFMGRTPLVIRRRVRAPFVEVSVEKNGYRKGLFYDHASNARGPQRRFVRSRVRKIGRRGGMQYRGKLYFRLPLRRGYRR